MKVINIKLVFSAVLLGFSLVSSAYADRILISDRDQSVSLSRTLDCYGAAELTIDTAQPEIYEQETHQLQLVVDAARAMLKYECPELSEINITGKIRGLNETVYEAKSTQANDWLLEPLSLAFIDRPQSNSLEQAYGETNWRTVHSGGKPVEGQLMLTGLKLGMTVQEATRIITEKFGVKPKYDTKTGRLSMHAGGCPKDFNIDHVYPAAQVEWKCLNAQFSDKRIPRLDRLELVQVATAETSEVHAYLVDNYGAPIQSRIGNINKEKLIWKGVKDESDGEQQLHELNAVLTAIGSDRVMTSLTLLNTSSDDNQMVNYAGLGLKL